MTPEVQNPLLGTEYAVTGTLGHGALAIVYEARRTTTGELVAVKMLRAAHAQDEQLLARFENEARVLRALQRPANPHVVGFFAAGKTSAGQPFIVLERLRGRTLARELRERGPLPVREAVQLVRQALIGLRQAHALGIAHRDLKPENLFLQDGVVKLLDFGLAKVLPGYSDELEPSPDLTKEGAIVGTPRFMSPEAALLEPVDLRADIAAVGWILSTLITGRLPFDTYDGVEEVLLAQALRDAEPPSVLAPGPIPVELDRIVLRALEKEPDRRYQNVAQLDAELAKVEGAMSRPHGWMDTAAIDGERVLRNLAAGRPGTSLQQHTEPEGEPAASEPAQSVALSSIAGERLAGNGSLTVGSPSAAPVPLRSRPPANVLLLASVIFLTAAVVTACVAWLVAGGFER